MYSNQFTNTKNSAQAQSLHKTDAFHGYMLGKNQKIPPKSFYKNDMRYIIPYSFSQQNEFYKVYNTKQEKQNKITVPQTACTARVPCGYLQDLASSRPATGHGQRSSGCGGATEGVPSIHKYLQNLFRLVNFYDNK